MTDICSASDPPRGPVTPKVPEGDTRERLVCTDCGFIDYRNPRIVVGTVALWGEKVLLCRRSIEPRIGYWTLPAGYMELGESSEEGAIREAREEACAEIEIDRLLAVYNIPRIGQVQLMYRGRLVTDKIAAGDETLEVGLFTWDDIPWDEIAFPTVEWALKQEAESRGQDDFAPFGNWVTA